MWAIVVALTLGALSQPRAADACTCAPSQPVCPPIGFETAIFVGTVVDIRTGPVSRTDGVNPANGARVRQVTLSVTEPLHAVEGRTIVVTTPEDSGLCGYPFEPGVSYFVVANRGPDGRLSVSQCSRTGPIDERRDDLEWVRDIADDLGLMRAYDADVAHLRLFGTVTFVGSLPGGAPVPFPYATVPDIKVIARTADLRHEAMTDSQGAFRFLDLPRGTYTVTAELEPPFMSEFDAERTVELKTCSAEAQLFVTTESIVGSLLEHDRSPVARAVNVTAVDADAVSRDRSVTTSSGRDGRWKFEGLPDGRYLIGVNVFEAPSATSPYPPVWYPGVAEAAEASPVLVTNAHPERVEVMLRPPLQTRVVAGVVIDVQDRPVPGASISLYDADWPDRALGLAYSDDQGRFSISAIAGRPLRLSARSFSPTGSLESDLTSVPEPLEDRPVRLTLWRTIAAPR